VVRIAISQAAFEVIVGKRLRCALKGSAQEARPGAPRARGKGVESSTSFVASA
jgi:hypothetical protein